MKTRRHYRENNGKKIIATKALWGLFLGLAVTGLAPNLHAGRFMTIPAAETLAEGKWSLWQFGLYEKNSTKTLRRLNRLDIGLYKGIEAGVFIVTPENGPSDTWLNLQYQPLAESGLRPAVSVGLWDLARKEGRWFSDRKSGPSPFISVLKTVYKWKDGYAKAGASYGFNRLHGTHGGLDVKHKSLGIMGEYAPENLRLKGSGAWDAGLYWWLHKNWRTRVSTIGGNPMFDVFYMHTMGSAR